MIGRASALVTRHGAVLDDACRCRFVREATDGSLSDGDFARYLLVEEAFVLTATRVLGRIVWESPTWSSLLPHARSLTNLITDQRNYFAGLREGWPLDEQDATRTAARAAVLSDVVLAQVAASGRPAAVTGMLAAETMYARWCRTAAEVPADYARRRQPDLQAWIALHTGQDFLDQVTTLSNDVDALDPAAVTDEDLDRWFSSVLRTEIAFHDAVHEEAQG